MQTSDDVAATVGRNVRALRQQRRMTIDALAAAAGVSRGTVIQVETARGNPSIVTLCNLASALKVGVASLVDSDAAPRLVVRRAEQAAPLWTSPAGSSAVFRIGTDPPDVVELWDWTLQPGDAFDGEAHPIGTAEVLSVLSGRLELRVGGRVRAGDLAVAAGAQDGTRGVDQHGAERPVPVPERLLGQAQAQLEVVGRSREVRQVA